MSAVASVIPPPLPRRRTRWSFWALLATFIAGVVYVYLNDPMSHWSIPCMFHESTGLYCPGCGLTRAMHALLHGQVWRAFRFNPLMTFIVPFVAWRILADTWEPRRRWCPSAAQSYFVLVVVLVFWIARNIPAYPFTLLAP